MHVNAVEKKKGKKMKKKAWGVRCMEKPNKYEEEEEGRQYSLTEKN